MSSNAQVNRNQLLLPTGFRLAALPLLLGLSACALGGGPDLSGEVRSAGGNLPVDGAAIAPSGESNLDAPDGGGQAGATTGSPAADPPSADGDAGAALPADGGSTLSDDASTSPAQEEEQQPPAASCQASPGYPANDACSRCLCDLCSKQVAGCYDSGDSARDAQCASVQACAEAAQCAGDACYCGEGNPLCLAPRGPCRQVIEGVVGSSLLTAVLLARDDPNHALNRANQIGTCGLTQCRQECGH